MARISGVNLPSQKRLVIGLTYVYGIGNSVAATIVKQAELDPDMKCKDLTEDQTNKIRKIIDSKYRTEGELRREVLSNVKRLKEINSWRGLRHAKNLPTRGQRTKTNSRTNRGNKRQTAGSGRIKSAQKT